MRLHSKRPRGLFEGAGLLGHEAWEQSRSPRPVWRWAQERGARQGARPRAPPKSAQSPRLASSACGPCGAKDGAGGGRGPHLRSGWDGGKVNSEGQAAQGRVRRSRHRFGGAVSPNLKTEVIMLQAVPSVCFSTPAYPLTHCLDLKSNTIDMRPGMPQK